MAAPEPGGSPVTASAPGVEIHVPITLNQHFNVMCCLLVRSMAARAQLPGKWKVIFTTSGDSTLTPEDPEVAWAHDYPVEFRPVRPEFFEAYSYAGTGLERHLYDYDAEVILFMDADVVITGSLDELVHRVASSPAVFGWPAWMPPTDFDLEGFLQDQGLTLPEKRVTYGGWGLAFMEPKESLPYFNYGLVAAGYETARKIGQTLEMQTDYVWKNNFNFFFSQIVLTLNIVDHGLDFEALDMKYNVSNGDLGEVPCLTGPVAEAAFARTKASVADGRVLHFCTRTDDFYKQRDLKSWEAVEAFMKRRCTGDGGRRVQDALRDLPFGSAPMRKIVGTA